MFGIMEQDTRNHVRAQHHGTRLVGLRPKASLDVHGTHSLWVQPMELAPPPFTKHGSTGKAHLGSEDPDSQGRIIPLVRVPNLNVLWVPMFVLRYAVTHAPLEFGDQTIKPERLLQK